MRISLVVVAVSLAALGCGGDDGGAVADAGAQDAASDDASAPDDVAPDDAPSVDDAALPDGPLPDAPPPADADLTPDAEVFDAAPCTPVELRVTNATGSSSEASLVWDGTGYGVAWGETRDGNGEIYFARLDADGVKIGDDVRITNDASTSEAASLVWTGTEYGIAWYDRRDGNYEVYFARIDAAGAKIGDDHRVTEDDATSWAPDLAWSGTEYGIAWWDTRDGADEIYFARLDATGAKIGDDVRVTTGADASLPQVIWNGTEYALAWGDSRDDEGGSELYFTRVSALGVKQGGDIRITSATGSSDLPSLMWNGTGYGLGWEDSRTGAQQLYFVRLDAAGVKQGTEAPITDRLFTRWNGVWNGAGYALTWTDNRDGNLEIYFARLRSTGARLDATDLRVTDEAATSRASSLSWNGTHYALVWADDRDGNTEVYFARICP
jgi:large repetitive protein